MLLGNVRNTDIDSQCLHAILDFTNCPFVKSHSVFVHEKRTTLSRIRITAVRSMPREQ